MNTGIAGALFAAAVAAAVLAPARAALYDTEAGYWFCSTREPIVYISSIFKLKGLGESEELRNAFGQALAAKYDYAGPVDCSMADKAATLEQLNLNKANRAAQLRQSGGKVIETAWSFEPTKARFSYVCTATAMRAADGQDVSLRTSPIAIGAGAARRLREAWSRHIKALGLSGSGRRRQCALLPATGADAALKALVDSCQCGKQIDWNGWDDGEPREAGAPPLILKKYLCDAWAFPPGRPPGYYWTGVFESALDFDAVNAKWRMHMKSSGAAGPVPTIFCSGVGVLPAEIEKARETAAKSAGASVVWTPWKD